MLLQPAADDKMRPRQKCWTFQSDAMKNETSLVKLLECIVRLLNIPISITHFVRWLYGKNEIVFQLLISASSWLLMIVRCIAVRLPATERYGEKEQQKHRIKTV